MARGFLKSGDNLYKRLFTLALPLAAQTMITNGMSLIDSLMVGSLGEAALSGVYLANQITYIYNLLAVGMGTTLVILAAQYWGKGDSGSVKTITAIAVKAALFVGFLFFAVVFIFARPILELLSNAPEAIDAGARYARTACFSYIFYCTSNALLASMRCVGKVRIGVITTVVMLVSSVALNAILIFGLLGFPAMGIMGAAISMVIAHLLGFSITLFYVFRIDQRLKFRLGDLGRFSGRLALDLLKYGTPVLLGDMFWGFGSAVQTSILGRLGSAVMSASSVAGNISQMFAVFAYGAANASGVIIGQSVGEGDMDKIKRYTKALQVVFIGLGLASGLLLFCLKDIMLLLYRDLQPETIEYARQFLVVMSVAMVGMGYLSTLSGIVRAGGSPHFVLVNDLIFIWLIVIPSSFLAAFVFGAPPWVVFALLKGDQIYKCFVALVKVNRFKWVKNLTREEEALTA